MRALRASLLAFALATTTAACAPAPMVPERPPPSAPPPEPAVLEIDPLPGSVAELEAIADDPAADVRDASAALERLAAILHAEGNVAADRAPFDAGAARALRRLLARDPITFRAHALASALEMALTGGGAVAEADALRRHVACPTLFPYAPGPSGAPPPVAPLSQDHDPRYWDAWEAMHPVPLDLVPRSGKGVRRGPLTPTAAPAAIDADTRYAPLYAGCPAEDASADGAEARAQAWIAVAREHRRRDFRGGPYAVGRAIEAYLRAIEAAAGAPRGPAMREARLQLGEALHEHERYHAAADEIVRGLVLCENTAACAPAERAEALTLLADSLMRVDYEGPPADAPVIPRADTLDTEPRPDVVSQKLRVGIDRATDPAIIPQERAFAAELFAALGQEYRDLALHDDARLAFEQLRRRFPAHRDLPSILAAAARNEEDAARMVRAVEGAPRWVRALASWDDLAALVRPDSAWHVANANDAGALAEGAGYAEKGGRAAADVLAALAATLGAVAAGTAALPVDDATARGDFRRATEVWTSLALPGKGGASARGVLAQISVAELAWLVRSAAPIEPERWARAWITATRARDDIDAVDRPAAARELVELADLQLRAEEARFTASHGTAGVAARAHALKPPLQPRAQEELPTAVEDAVRMRDSLVEVTASGGWDGEKIGALTAAAGLLFAYGHTVEADLRLFSAVALACKQAEGFDAFTLAASVARAGHDTAALARLAALHADPAKTCAKSAAERGRGRALTEETR